jgi:hypothetical protein
MLHKSFSASDMWIIKFGASCWNGASNGKEHVWVTLLQKLASSQSCAAKKAGTSVGTKTGGYGRRSDASYLLSGFCLIKRLIQENPNSRGKWTFIVCDSGFCTAGGFSKLLHLTFPRNVS